jgi:hypothetical protein
MDNPAISAVISSFDHDFRSNTLELFDEMLDCPTETPSTRFVDRGSGFLNTLAALTAAQASAVAVPEATSIVAHSEHTRFYMQMLLEFMAGRTERVEWSASWQLPTVDDATWLALQTQLRAQADAVRLVLQNSPLTDDMIGGTLNILCHTSYHLGAIRQMLKLLP